MTPHSLGNMAGNACPFDGKIICAVLVVLLLPTCFPLSPIYKDKSKTISSVYCGTGTDCCGLCSNSDDCIYWLNCCDHDKNEIAKRLLNMDCVSIVHEDPEFDNADYIENIATVVMCPNGTFCDRGTMVGGKTFVYISEACAICNGEVVYKPFNISAYATKGMDYLGLGDKISIKLARWFLIEEKFNENVTIRNCNKNHVANQNYSTRCGGFGNELACADFSWYLTLPEVDFMFCHTCSGYNAINCRSNLRSGAKSALAVADYGFIFNSFDLAELLEQRVMYNGQPRTDVDCPKGHILSHSKVKINISLK